MARLIDCFAPLLTFGRELDAAIDAGTVVLEHDVAQQRARGLVDVSRAAARDAEKPADQIESATFAVVAWIDEVLDRHPGATGKAARLQVALFNSNNADSEFFHHLSVLRPQDEEVREVYLHALALGFKGQYYFENDDSGRLGKLKDLHARQMEISTTQPGALVDLGEAPRASGARKQARAGRSAAARRRRKKRRAAIAFALFIALAGLLWYLVAAPRAA